MKEMTLEQQFSCRKLAHIYAILKFKMMEYYATIEMGKVNLPNFLREDSPEKKAEKDIDWLLKHDKKTILRIIRASISRIGREGIIE